MCIRPRRIELLDKEFEALEEAERKRLIAQINKQAEESVREKIDED